ncbi:MAG: hypothetical protein AABX13_05315 [Nanoarchaeota archaeon]
MNTKTILFFLIVLSLFLLSCQKRSTELGSLSFQELCQQNGDQWMEMEPMKEGKMLSTQKCFGCMVGENHFCSGEEYSGYINTLPSWMKS